ncbi:MAG: hypothetical protein IID44_18745 [Planctomycetes bacterium]|nr:hypothetical protein [Planctomycetota bacterium]
MTRPRQNVLLAGTVVCAILLGMTSGDQISLAQDKAKAKPKKTSLTIAEANLGRKVDFEKDVLPIFRKNCLACHNSSEAESDLVMETPQTILTGGGEGPSVVAGKSANSLLLKMAAHQMEPFMPPEDNDVGAKPLTPQQLGIIKKWIDEGATGQVKGTAGPLKWQALPRGANPIYAVAISPDGQWAVCGRANQIFIYHVPSGREMGRLTDPELLKGDIYKNRGVAHLDMVQSLAFSPNGELLASGGYRTVKLWRLPRSVKKSELGAVGDVKSLAVTADGKTAAVGEAGGAIKLWDLTTGKTTKTLAGHKGAVTGLAFSADGKTLVSGSADKTIREWDVAGGKEKAQTPTTAEITALALVSGDKQVATGEKDNTIRIWALPSEQPKPEPAKKDPAKKDEKKEDTAPKPIKELKGHTGAINSLAVIGADGKNLLSGSADGTLRHWGVDAGNQVRSMAHGGPVTSVAVSSDGQRFASSGTNNVSKLWNAADGKQVVEMKGNQRLYAVVAKLTRTIALAKGKVTDTQAELKAGQDRKKKEEANLKKAGETKTKADATLKQKTEAAKKPTADKQAADKDLATAKPLVKTTADAKTAADTIAKQAAEDFKKATAAKTAAAKVATAAKAVFTKATQDKTAKDTVAKQAATVQTAATAAADKAAAVFKTATTAKAAAAKVATAANPAFVKATQDKTAKDTAAKQAITTQTTAKANADKSKAALAKDAKNQGLINADRATQKALAGATTKNKAAADALAASVKLLAAADAKNKDALAKKTVADKAATDTDTKNKAAQKVLVDATAKSKVATDAVAATVKVLAAADVKNKDAVAKKTVADKAGTDSDTKNKAAKTALAATTKAATDATNKVKTAEANVKKVKAPFDKAIGEMTTAKNALAAAVRSVTAGTTSVKKSTDVIPGFDAAIKTAQAAQAKFEADMKTAQAASTAAEKPFGGVAFSADSWQLAAAGTDGKVHTYDAKTGKPIDVYEGHGGPVARVIFAAGGELLSIGADQKAILWNTAAEWKLERTIGDVDDGAQLVDRVIALDFSSDSKLLATGGGEPSRSGQLKIWNVADGALVREFKDAHSDTIFSLEFSPNNDRIVTGAADRFVKVFEVASGKFERAFEGHSHHVLGVSWQRNGKTIVSGGADKVMKVWNAKTGDQKKTVSGMPKEVTSINFVGDGENFIISGGGSVVRIYKSSNGGQVRALSGASDFVYATAASDDGAVVAAGGQNSVLSVWNAADGKTLGTFAPPKDPDEEKKDDKVSKK